MSLATAVKVDQVLGYFAAAQTARKGAIIDMAGYEGCMFIFQFGTILNTGTIACDINADDVNNTAGMTKLAGGASHTVTATTAALTQSAIVVDIFQPTGTTYRYLEPMITLGVANTLILGITAIRYNGKVKPELTDGLLAQSIAVSPAAA
jgi:hypothetical protein